MRMMYLRIFADFFVLPKVEISTETYAPTAKWYFPSLISEVTTWLIDRVGAYYWLGELKQDRWLMHMPGVECRVRCLNPQWRSSVTKIDPENCGNSKKSIFMEGQCFLKSHSGSAPFPSVVALGGQYQACVGVQPLLLPQDKDGIAQIKGMKGWMSFTCPFFPSWCDC